METLSNILNLGFTYQEPTKDKTHFFVRQSMDCTEMIWIEVKKKTPFVTYKRNYVEKTLPNELGDFIAMFIFELGYDEFALTM